MKLIILDPSYKVTPKKFKGSKVIGNILGKDSKHNQEKTTRKYIELCKQCIDQEQETSIKHSKRQQ